MASRAAEEPPVRGRVNRAGILVAADPQLEALQRDAGADIGDLLALPQLAAIARLAFRLGIALERPAVAASATADIDLWVRAVPAGDEVELALDRWEQRPAAPPRLHLHGGQAMETEPAAGALAWATDPELKLTRLSPPFARFLGVDENSASGASLNRLLQLVEGDDGDLPLLSALSARRGFSGQRARARSGGAGDVLLDGEVLLDAQGNFSGFEGIARIADGAEPPAAAAERKPTVLDAPLDTVLRGPLDRIIAHAEQISGRTEGPLRGDYASYGDDIAAAARHLLSVIESMGGGAEAGQGHVDLAALAAETLMLVEPIAQARGVNLALDADRPAPAIGEERAVIQILVNLITNAVRHSPPGSEVRLSFDCRDGRCSVSVTDQGGGIAAADRDRIFERFERGDEAPGSAGLGLPIARRLARSMGGDVILDQPAGSGARFTLTLKQA